MAADTIRVVAYDPDWPARFAEERAAIAGLLDDGEWLDIEHFGSTAVPGLAAKPIIDIVMAVPSLEAARETFPERFSTLDYVFWADNPKTDRLYFVKGMPPYGKARTHHLHVCERPSSMWERLAFRDYLRAHPDEAARYAALKRELAERYAEDRDAYTDAKGEFVAEIMERARAG